MKAFLTFLFSLVLVLGANAQDEEKLTRKELRILNKVQRETEQQAEMDSIADLMSSMITQQQFVLVADKVKFRFQDDWVMVSSKTYFILVDSSRCTVSFGVAGGYNTFGALIYEGPITKYEYRTIGNKEGSYNVEIHFTSIKYDFNISITTNPRGYAFARHPSFEFNGTLVPLKLSNVYKDYR
ncbi:hypothetical protein ES705_27999 [subsurface metagenome]